MLLIAVGSTTAPPSPYGSYSGCDSWLVSAYFYDQESKYKAAYYGNRKCYMWRSNNSQQHAIDSAKTHCEKDGPYCFLLAVGNQVYGYLSGSAMSGYSGQNFNITQNYTGENNVCNSTVPGGCTGAFKP